jgi:ketosteroid isomerase-like protein
MNNETQIRTLIENWAAAVRNRDMDAIMAHHSEDLMMYDVPPPFQSTGLEAYRETWDMFFKYNKTGVFDIKELHVVANGEVAFCYATMKCSDTSDPCKFVEFPFRLTIGLKKIADQWVILHEHHSVPCN